MLQRICHSKWWIPIVVRLLFLRDSELFTHKQLQASERRNSLQPDRTLVAIWDSFHICERSVRILAHQDAPCRSCNRLLSWRSIHLRCSGCYPSCKVSGIAARSVLVFCEFMELQRTLQRAIADRLDFVADIINGDTPAASVRADNRQRRIKKFQEAGDLG